MDIEEIRKDVGAVVADLAVMRSRVIGDLHAIEQRLVAIIGGKR